MAKAKTAILAEPKGLDVATVTELRRKCREAQVEYRIVKNTLAIRAAKGQADDGNMSPITDVLVVKYATNGATQSNSIPSQGSD